MHGSQVSDPLIDDRNKREPCSRMTIFSIVLVSLTLIAVVIFTTIEWINQSQSDSNEEFVIIRQNLELDSRLAGRIEPKQMAKNICIKVIKDSNNELTLKIYDADNKGFELPETEHLPNNNRSQDIKDGNYNYEYTLNSKTGAFVLYRKDNKEVIFDTTGHGLIVTEFYTQFATTLNSAYLYGLGERRKTFRYTGTGNYTTWPKDQFGRLENGTPSNQLYGYHPMWLVKGRENKFHIGFLKSTSALLTQVTEGDRMIFHVMGGSIVLKFFIGTNQPEPLIQSYHRYINGFGIHPFWSQGYHQCRWGYKSSKDLLDVVTKMNDNNHPVESVWNDLDYMTDYQDFTLHPDFKPAEMQQLTDETKPEGVKWIPLIDIGIAVKTEAENRGKNYNVFLKSSYIKDASGNASDLQGCAWPGPVVFPDFNHPNATKYWLEMTNYMKDTLQTNPGGYWIDMNELASFIPGELNSSDPAATCPGATPIKPPVILPVLDDRRYLPVDVAGENPLAHKTVTLDTLHYSGHDAALIKDVKNLSEVYFHSLNNLAEQIATHTVLQQFTGKNLTFSLTRASIYGSGRYTTHWTGDNLAQWEFLRLGVSELLPFQFYGIPMVGNDLCGFAFNTEPELCAKWLALGAWEPFARNHNDNESISQEPYAFPQSPYVLKASVAAFQNRYSLLKWMYSLFLNQYEKNLGAGTGTVIQPVWWLNTSDETAFQFEDSEFIFGKTFLIVPVLTKGDAATETTQVKAYFPSTGKWVLCEDFKTIYEGGKTVDFERKFEQMALSFQRAGTLVFRQIPQKRARLLNNEFTVQAFLNEQASATGQIMTLKDYEENLVFEKCMITQCVAKVTINYEEQNNKVIVKVEGSENYELFKLNSIEILTDQGKQIQLQVQKEITKSETFEFTVNP